MAKVLTDPTVKGAKPRLSEKTQLPVRTEVPDAILPGLYLIVQPDGRKKSWAVRYRHQGKPVKYTIGPYPRIGLAAAREHGRKVLEKASYGADPHGDKRRQAASPEANTFNVVVPRYLLQHAKAHRSTGRIRRYFEVDVLPQWGRKRLDEIERRDVLALVDAVVARGSPFSANTVLKNVKAFYNWAMEKDLVASSPCKGLKPPAVSTGRERVLNDDELRWLWQACGGLGVTGGFVRMLMLTGQRRTEVAGLSEAELIGRVWTIPAARTKNKHEHRLQLPEAAVQVLANVPRIGTKGLYFTLDGAKPISGFSAAKERVDAAMLAQAKADGVTEIPAWTFHDIRRTVASNLAKLDIAVHVAEAVLNHKSGTIKGVAAVYNRYDYAREKEQALAAWANALDEIVSGQPRGNVVPLRG
jgi:integrase